MTTFKLILKSAFILMILNFTNVLAETLPESKAAIANSAHKPITNELIELLKNNPEIKTLLEASIIKAKEINPDPKSNPVQNLSDYYHYIDNAVDLIPMQILIKPSNLLREQIMQSLCYFYFLIDQPLDALKDKGLYMNSIQYVL